MKFRIVYDTPGRIRFRCGGYAFEKELECSVYKTLTAEDFVSSVQVRSENGGILVCYKKGCLYAVACEHNDIFDALTLEHFNKNYRFILTFNSSLLVLGLLGVLSPSTSALLHNASTMMICAKSMTPLMDKKKKEEEK